MRKSYERKFRLHGKSIITYPELKRCCIEFIISKAVRLHSYINLDVNILVNDVIVFRFTRKLIWEDMHLLDLYKLALLLANIKQLEDKSFVLIDEIGWKEGHELPIEISNTCHGIDITIFTDIKVMRKQKLKKDKRLWFLDWKFFIKQNKRESEVSKAYCFLMIVNPSECEKFGKMLQKYTLDLDEELFLRWSKEDGIT